MPEERRQVTLSKAHRATPVGRQLIELLVELSADGIVSRDEMSRLRAWLEIDHGIDFPALPFLYETIDQMSSDGDITEDELDLLALAIERVLPKDIRLGAIATRKQAREARRAALRETQRQALIATRSAERVTRDAERARAGVLFKTDFPIAGATRFAERREACERLLEGDIVTLEREPSNVHDSNAILVLGQDECELGYVRREEASEMAPFLDAGAEADARIHRLWATPEGKIVPILMVTIRRGEAGPSVAVKPTTRRRPLEGTPEALKATRRGQGCATAVCILLALILAGIAAL